MRASISQLKRYMECPAMMYYEYNLHRVPIARSMPLDLGSAAHAATAALIIGADPDQAVNAYLSTLSAPRAIEVGEEWEFLRPLVTAWQPPDDWTIHSVEKEYAIPCGPHTIVGTLDAPTEWNGLMWHLQHKTIAYTKPLTVFQETTRTDWHEIVYGAMLRLEFPHIPLGGTLLHTITKPTVKTRDRWVAEGTCHMAHNVSPLEWPQDLETSTFSDLEQILNDIEAMTEGRRTIVRNRRACGGPYQNSLCAYKRVCDGEHSLILNDEHFVTIEERYAQKEA